MLAIRILRLWYDPEYPQNRALFREVGGMNSMDFLYRDFPQSSCAQWQREGKSAPISQRHDMRCSGDHTHRFHKEEIGLNFFPALQDYLTDFLSAD
jgi:hypothetical protein